jgi:transcriptional regulator with XRE-family HTH domain
MTSSPLEQASDEFASALSHWRNQRGLTKRALASEMGFDPSYVSHVEGRRHRPTQDFARRAEFVLRAGGAIWRTYTSYEAVRQTASNGAAPDDQQPISDPWLPPGTGLVVEREHAALGLHDHRYFVRIKRHLYNAGTDPVVRYPVRIRVDRYPAHPRRSARLHHGSPLTWPELGFTAQSDGEPMAWRVTYDSDAVKELWLHLDSVDRRFPLYPGQRTTIEYAYHVGDDKWGPWFQRAIRMPTLELAVDLDLPAADRPVVWGTVSSLSVDGAPLGQPEVIERGADRLTYSWTVSDPPLQARYRLEWRLPEDSHVAEGVVLDPDRRDTHLG